MINKKDFQKGQKVKLIVRYTEDHDYEYIQGTVSQICEDDVMLDLSKEDGYSIALYYFEIKEIVKC